MKMKKYNCLTEINELPKEIQKDICIYIKAGYTLGDVHIPKNEQLTKSEILNCTINDISELFPIDTLIQTLNKQS